MISRFAYCRFLALFALAPLAACSAVGGGDDFAVAAPPVRGAVSFSAAGVPGLAAGTPYSAKTIQASMPGFEATPVTMATESSESVSALALFQDGLQVMQVLPGADGQIGAIHGVSDRLAGPNGERIGMSFREARMSRSDCREGQGNWLGMAICKARNAPNVSFVFSVPGYISSSGLPDDATLATATLQRMIWVPIAS